MDRPITSHRSPDQARGESQRIDYRIARAVWPLYLRTLSPLIRRLFFTELIRATQNFSDTTWLGQPMWQNVLDLHIMQETIFRIKPSLLIETGTNRGGSALFFASLF